MAKSAAENHWNYEGVTGPEQWGALDPRYANCAEGRQQSPVDITGATRPHPDQVRFNYAPSALKLVNTGRTIQVNYDPGSYLTIGSRRYDLLQFHFHSPGEHTIDGQVYDMETHLVHRSADRQLAIVAVLMAVGEENATIQTLWDNLPSEEGIDTAIRGVTIDVQAWIPPKMTYYAYSGSLTTPPCSGGVRWIILQTPATISAAQVESFTDRFPRNARPVQPLNDRALFEGVTRR